MSLVNKVLRDLDARRAGEGERTALPVAVTPLGARLERPARWRWILLAVAAAAIVFGLAFYYLKGGGLRDDPVVPAAPLQAAAPVPAAEAPQPVAPAPAVAVATPPADPVARAAEGPSAGRGMAQGGGDGTAPSGLRLSDELARVPPPRQRSMAPNPPRYPAEKPTAASPASANAAPANPVSAPKALAPVSEPALPAKAAARIDEPAAEARVEKQERKPSPAEISDAHYRRGLAAQRQGNAVQATSLYRQALDVHADHALARQALVARLLEARQFDEAEELLRQGLEIPAARMASVLSLARLKVEKGDAATALDLLLRHAAAGERSAEYQGFLGALLNRSGRSAEAIERYQAATRLAPAEARWWVGLGISLEAGGRASEARGAYLRARDLPGLPADLAQLVEQRLR